LPGPFDGEESVTLIPDLDAGATGTMSSATVPGELGQVVRRYLAGDRAGAVGLWEGLLPLIHFENRQCGLRAQKILLAEGGIIDCDRTRAPFGPVSPRTRRGLVELAEARDLVIMRWGRLPGLSLELGWVAVRRLDGDALHALAATGGVEGAGVRGGEPLGPSPPLLAGDVAVEVLVGERDPVVPLPAVGVQGGDRLGIGWLCRPESRGRRGGHRFVPHSSLFDLGKVSLLGL
jgi:hypothetical protein